LSTCPDGRFASLAEARVLAYCSSQASPLTNQIQLDSGAGGNALACYQEALQIRPGNTRALAGITAIEDTIDWINWRAFCEELCLASVYSGTLLAFGVL
jgi:hypothetical protein